MVVSGTAFPDGHGATVRLREFARGFHDAGIDTRILLLASMRPADWPDTGAPARGLWRDIPYEFMSGLAHGETGWVRRRFSEIRAVRRACAEIVASRRSGPPAAVVIVAESLRWILPVAITCRLAGVPIVNSRSEFPFVYHGDVGVLRRLWQRAYCATVFRLFDGFVAISEHLEAFARSRLRRNAWIMRIPILVDASRFDCAGEPERGLVGYAGSLVHPEELEALIEAVSVVRRTHPEVHVRIVGGDNERELSCVRDLARRYDVQDAIEAGGFAEPDRVPGLLCGCSALALPRAAGLFSTAGMPTKLGEYLATGRPVVVTATGDIPLYLHDGVEAFVVPPADQGRLAAALEAALYEPDSAAIGSAGRALALREFDSVRHMERLYDAIRTGRVDSG
jgi:glycosyltransferase involved in cell wall biosynthesis